MKCTSVHGLGQFQMGIHSKKFANGWLTQPLSAISMYCFCISKSRSAILSFCNSTWVQLRKPGLNLHSINAQWLALLRQVEISKLLQQASDTFRSTLHSILNCLAQWFFKKSKMIVTSLNTVPLMRFAVRPSGTLLPCTVFDVVSLCHQALHLVLQSLATTLRGHYVQHNKHIRIPTILSWGGHRPTNRWTRTPMHLIVGHAK